MLYNIFIGLLHELHVVFAPRALFEESVVYEYDERREKKCSSESFASEEESFSHLNRPTPDNVHTRKCSFELWRRRHVELYIMIDTDVATTRIECHQLSSAFGD